MRRSISPKSVSSGWAMSAVKQTTLTPFSVSQRVTVQESRPPDAAKATVWPLRSARVVMEVILGGEAQGRCWLQYNRAGRAAHPREDGLNSRRGGQEGLDDPA